MSTKEESNEPFDRQGADADADAAVLVHEPARRGDLDLPAARLRARLPVHVGGGEVHAVRVVRQRGRRPLSPLPPSAQRVRTGAAASGGRRPARHGERQRLLARQ